MRNTRHSKNIGSILYETNMWTSKILPGTKWWKSKYGISWHVHVSTNPWELKQGKTWFIGVCSRRKWENQHRTLIYISSCGNEGRGRTKKGRGRRFICILSSHEKMGSETNMLKPGAWEEHEIPTQLPSAYACWLNFMCDLQKIHLFYVKT